MGVGEILSLKCNKLSNYNEELPVSIYAKIYESAGDVDIKENTNSKDNKAK